MNKPTTLLAVAAFVVTALTMFRDSVVDGVDDPPGPANLSQPMASKPLAAPALEGPVNDEVGKRAQTDSGLAAHVALKYRFLLSELRLDAPTSEKLTKYLLERESITQAAEKESSNGDEDVGDLLRRHQLRLTEIDAGVQALLQAADQANYTALKDSDAEQRRLYDYLGGIRNVAPLDERQERAILEAKLRQKQRYQGVVRDSGLDRDVLSSAEREYAHANLARGLKQYLDDFLVETAPVLTHDQYVLLRSYETTEFTLELDRLQRKINAK